MRELTSNTHTVPVPLPYARAVADDARSWFDGQVERGRQSYRNRHGLEPAQWRGRDLSDDEVTGLHVAFQRGLVELDDEGTVLVTRFRSAKRYQLYLRYDGGTARPGRAWTWSWQEAFTQVAFAAELVVQHDWPVDDVALEVDRMDVAAGVDPVSAPALLAEAKLTDDGPSGLRAMLAVFDELSGGPSAQVSAGVRNNATPKYDCLLRLRPAVFVAVAPGVRRAFDTRYDDGRVMFTRRCAPVRKGLIIAGG